MGNTNQLRDNVEFTELIIFVRAKTSRSCTRVRSWSNEEQQTLGSRRSALSPPVTAAAAADRTRLSFDGDDASVHEHGALGL